MVDEKAKDERSEKQKREEMIRQDELLALKLLKDGLSRRSKIKRPKVRKVTHAAQANSPFKREYRVSPELSTFLGGETKISRPQVVKRVWDHIKSNNLQDPQDRRTIICDEKLEAIFKKSMLRPLSKQAVLV